MTKIFFVALIVLACVMIAYSACVIGGREDDQAEKERHYNGDPEHDQQVDAAWYE